MLHFLFPRLTTRSKRGTALFAAATHEARQPHWYRNGEVPDSLNGRFAMLATIVALIIVRLERDGAEGDALSVALTERFIAVMESEHRELGLGDPGLGRKVRRLVGSLANRTELWRSAIGGERAWKDAARESVYGRATPAGAVEHSADSLSAFWSRLDALALTSLAEGDFE